MPKTKTLLILGALAGAGLLLLRRSSGAKQGTLSPYEVKAKALATAPQRMQRLMSSSPTPITLQPVMAGYFPTARRHS